MLWRWWNESLDENMFAENQLNQKRLETWQDFSGKRPSPHFWVVSPVTAICTGALECQASSSHMTETTHTISQHLPPISASCNKEGSNDHQTMVDKKLQIGCIPMVMVSRSRCTFPLMFPGDHRMLIKMGWTGDAPRYVKWLVPLPSIWHSYEKLHF